MDSYPRKRNGKEETAYRVLMVTADAQLSMHRDGGQVAWAREVGRCRLTLSNPR